MSRFWGLVLGITGFVALPGMAAERWTDSRMPVTAGLVTWLDAATLNAARQASGQAAHADGDPLELWPDGSGHKRDVRQPQTKSRPQYRPTGDFHAVRFDGASQHLRGSKWALSPSEMTVFIVTAPFSNPEAFSAWLSMSATDRNDYMAGLNIDQGVGNPPKLQVVNVEGAGHPGLQNLLKTPAEYGSVLRMCLASAPGKNGTVLWVNGTRQGARDRAENSAIQLNEFVLGARFYTHGGPPEARGFLHGDVAEVLVYDRLLPESERAAVEQYLKTKYGSIAPLPVPGVAAAGKPLDRITPPPPVQVLVPGFAVRALPVELPNVNNVLYRPDGKLVALGYDGNVWLLSDSNGDGLEDAAALFWENKGQIRGPIGMALTRPNDPVGQGVFVASKGKCSLLVDTDRDDKADREIVVASGWKELPHGVDALGVAVDPRDGSVYFGLGTQDYTNAYLTRPDGTAGYDLAGERGTILRVAPNYQSREIVCTGIRFPVGLRFNRAGDLFCTDQEGATWLPNGNPFDELLHIQKGRHYGFPPRHPRHLPSVIDEPSTFDYGPQHQSTCGLAFNEPFVPDGPTFGPAAWAGDGFVTGYSRGKLYRTQLVKTDHGYIARSSLFACLASMPADCCITPDGSLLVACHSGGPDWGSGPTGKGTLFKIRYADREHPQPVLAWAAGPREVRIEFDRPVDPKLLQDALSRIDITAGKFVRAGDRFESLWPGYSVVQMQHRSPRRDVKVYSAQLTPDQRTLVLATDSLRAAVHYAVTLPGMGRPTEFQTDLPQQPQIDLDFDLSGVEAQWLQNGQLAWNGWLPSFDLAVSQQWTIGSASHDRLWAAMREAGELALSTGLNLADMLRPTVQPGSKIEYEWPAEQVSLHLRTSAQVQTKPADLSRLQPPREDLMVFEARLTGTSAVPQQTMAYSTAEDGRQRPFPPHRALLPWGTLTEEDEPLSLAPPPELAGGSWARGWKLFHHEQTGCAKCHAVHGQGAKIGPDLSNLIHRDYASVLRDITLPSFAINPDYLSSTLALADGRVVTGVVRTIDGRLHVGDAKGQTIVVDSADVEAMKLSPVSVMPEGLLKPFTAEQTRDLLTFLLMPGPSMPREKIGVSRPAPRSMAEINAVLGDVTSSPEQGRPLRVVLVAGPKDHGPGEHDYPAWLKAWSELLAIRNDVDVVTAMGWPDAAEFDKADVMVFYQRGDWTAQRAADIDAYLARGGGLVYVHWAVDGQKDAPGFAQRIALAWGPSAKFRHGPLTLHFNHDPAHPVARGFTTLKLVDESYWNLTGTLPKDRILGTGVEDGQPQPLFWSTEQGRGRVFVSIPGHYSWTFDDPLFRLLLLRGIAWSANEPVDRFNNLIWPGADLTK
jgi:putative heme-binding domain-containing protein